jgi:hypothetical protein
VKVIDPLDADFLGIPIDQKYVFGKQNMPSSDQLLRGTLAGLIDPFNTGFGKRTDKKIQDEINEHNNAVMARAELLTYYDQVLGYKIGPRVQISGMGGAASKAVLPVATRIEIPEIPSMYMFYPSEGLKPPPGMENWTNDQIVGFAMDSSNNGYAHYLNSGGDPIPIVDDVVKKIAKSPEHKDKVSDVQSIKAKMRPRQEQIEEEKTEFEADEDISAENAVKIQQKIDAELDQLESDAGKELENLPYSSTMEDVQRAIRDVEDIEETAEQQKEEIDNMTKWKIYNSITSGMGYSTKPSNNVKSDIYKTKGGRQWIEDYVKKNGQPKTAEEKQRMIDAWQKVYPVGTPNKAIADYPQVPKYVKQPINIASSTSSSSTDPPISPGDKGVDPDRPPEPTKQPEQLLSEREQVITEMIRHGMSLEQAVRTYDYVTENNLRFSMDPDKPGDVNYNKGTGSIQGIPPDFTPSKDDPILTIVTDPTTGLQTATRSPEYDPDPSKTEEQKKPEPGKKTSTSSPEADPGFSRTKIDTEAPTDEDKKTKPRPIPPMIPDQPDKPKPPEKPPRRPGEDPDKTDPSLPWIADESAVGYKRPEYWVGGQDILKTTQKERLEEIGDWDLFDLPIQENTAFNNPLYIRNLQQDLERFYEAKHTNMNTFDNILKTQDKAFLEPAYSTPIRKTQHEQPERYKTMQSIMRPINVKTPFHDPYDRRLMRQFANAYRRSEGEVLERLDRGTNIYPDLARKFIPIPSRPTAEESVSLIDLMLSEK